MRLEPPLNLASTNGSGSWTKAEHVGGGQDFRPPRIAAAVLSGLVCTSLGVNRCRGAWIRGVWPLPPAHLCLPRAAGRKVSKRLS